MNNAGKILEIFQKDCRISLEQAATMLDMTAADVAQTIDELEKKNIILGYGAIVNWDSTDRDFVSAHIEIKVTPQTSNGFDRIARRIQQHSKVKSLCLMSSGSYDFFLTIEGRTLKEVALFVSEYLAPMEDIISTATRFVLKRYKENGVIFGNTSKDEREVISL